MGVRLFGMAGLLDWFFPKVQQLDPAGTGTASRPGPAPVARELPRPRTQGAGSFFRFHVTQDPDGLWWWTLLTVNGHAVARSAHGYVQRLECEQGLHRLMLADHTTPIVRH